MYLALLLITREHVGHTLVATRLDGIVSGFAVASLLASVTMSTAIDSTAGAPLAERLTNLEALAELRRCAGAQFDVAVVAAFERVLVDARELAVVPRSA